MDEEIWELLGIPATGDEREIRRAYARRLKARRPDEDPEGFQELRQAYETALRLAAWPDAEEGQESPEAESAGADQDGAAAPVAEASPLRLRLDAELAKSPAAAAEFLGGVLGEDLGLAASDALELEIVAWLAQQERPPAQLIELAARRFRWFELAAEQQPLEPPIRYLLARHRGYAQVHEILWRGKLKRNAILETVADWLNGSFDDSAAALRLRRSGLDRGSLAAALHHFSNAFRFEIDTSLVEWIHAQLPPPKRPSLLRRLQLRIFAADFELPEAFGRWRWTYSSFLLLAAPAMLLARVPAQSHHYAYLAAAPFLPALAEFARAFVRRRKIRFFDRLPTVLLWTVLAFAVASQLDFRSTAYAPWWAATVLAILLAYEDDPPPDLWMGAHFAGALVFFFCPIWQVEQPAFAPFALFFVPLLRFPGAFFGRHAPSERASRVALATLYAAAVLTAAGKPAGGDPRRILLGIALVLLVLLLRAYRFRLGDLIVLPLLVALAANQLGTTLAASPALLLLFLPGILLWKALDPFFAPIAGLSSQTRIGR